MTVNDKKTALSTFLSKRERIRFLIKRILVFSPFWFSHHPPCDNFSSEVIKIGNFRVCRGCTIVYVTTIFIIVIILLFRPFSGWKLLEITALVLMITIPTWVAVFHRFTRRLVKDVVRATLGISLGIAISELVIQGNFLIKMAIFIAIMVVYYLFKWLRKKQHIHLAELMCPDCRHLTERACLDAIRLLEAERLFSRELSEYLQAKLRNDVIFQQSLMKKE